MVSYTKCQYRNKGSLKSTKQCWPDIKQYLISTNFWLKGMAIKINFVLFERNFEVIYEDPVQIFCTLLGFQNILTENSVQPAILVL